MKLPSLKGFPASSLSQRRLEGSFLFSVPELTGSTDIKLNERVLLLMQCETLSSLKSRRIGRCSPTDRPCVVLHDEGSLLKGGGPAYSTPGQRKSHHAPIRLSVAEQQQDICSFTDMKGGVPRSSYRFWILHRRNESECSRVGPRRLRAAPVQRVFVLELF
jgi:hypothetical protein